MLKLYDSLYLSSTASENEFSILLTDMGLENFSQRQREDKCNQIRILKASQMHILQAEMIID